MIYIIHLLLFFSTNTALHEFHVSKSDVNYDSDEKALQLTIHLFIDDFELGLKEYSDEKLKLFDTQEYIKSDSLINLYLSKYLTFKIDEKEVPLNFIGKEISDDLLGAWCYLEVENLSSFNQVEINNSILTNVFDDQKNIINIKVDNKSKAFHILDKSDNIKVIDI